MQIVIATVFLFLAWLLQLHLIFPLEQALRPENSNVDAFSFVFIPHGAKVLVAMFLMTWSLPVILIVSFVAGLMFGFDPTYAFLGAVLAAITAIMPIWLFNFVSGKPIDYRVFRYDNGNLNLFRASMLLVVAVAFVNSAFQAALAKTMLDINPDLQLTIGFLTGISSVALSVLHVQFLRQSCEEITMPTDLSTYLLF